MYSEFKQFITSLASKTKIYIFLHQNADPDALCSAEGLKHLLLNSNQLFDIKLFVDSLNVSSSRIADALDIEISTTLPQNQADVIITVDTANFSQLSIFEEYVRESFADKVVIDHHSMSELAENTEIKLYETQYGSTCLIVAKLYETMGYKPTPRISTILICGHLYDSRRFIHGSTADTFRMIAELIDFGGNYYEANDYLQNPTTTGEKIARIKACKRINYRIVENHIIASTKVSAFESSAARSLVGLGVDIILVLASKSDEVRGSARAKIQNQLHMGKILDQLIDEFKKEHEETVSKIVCSSGGHKNAAGLNIKSSLTNKQQQKIMTRFMDIVETKLLQRKES